MKRIAVLPVVALAVAVSAGCATYVPAQAPAAPPAYPAAAPIEYGQIHSIDLLRAENQTSGGGALVGGVAGAVVGRQFGSGSGRTAGTLIGAVAGAVIGNEIEKQNRGARDVYRVVVRTDRGQLRAFDYAQLGEVRVGDRVRIENNQVYRY
jgi:outer membrane lipoprotein SlyB